MHWKEQLSCDFDLGFVASQDASCSLDIRQLNWMEGAPEFSPSINTFAKEAVTTS
jgi:hypothetical protein